MAFDPNIKIIFRFISARSSLLFDIGIPNSLARWCFTMRQHVCTFMTCVWPWPLTNIHGWLGVLLMSFAHSFYLVFFFFKKKILSPRNLASKWRKQLWWVRKALYVALKYFEEALLVILWKCIILPHFGKRGILFCICQSVYGSSDVLSYLRCSLTWYSGSL